MFRIYLRQCFEKKPQVTLKRFLKTNGEMITYSFVVSCTARPLRIILEVAFAHFTLELKHRIEDFISHLVPNKRSFRSYNCALKFNCFSLKVALQSQCSAHSIAVLDDSLIAVGTTSLHQCKLYCMIALILRSESENYKVSAFYSVWLT